MDQIGDGDYVERAIRLRVSASWNERDEKITRDGVTIVPAFDADIVKLFLDPKGTLEYVAPVLAGGPKDVAARANVLGLFAKITAEFLFLSKDLVVSGRAYPSLWKSSPAIAPGHRADVDRMMSEVGRKLRRQAMNSQTTAIEQSDVDKARAALARADELCRKAQNESSPQLAMEAIESVGKQMPAAMEGFLSGPNMEAIRFVRMMDGELIIPLESLSVADTDILSPPRTEIAVWRKLILDAKKNRPSKERRNAKAKAESDATALCQIDRLNRRAIKEKELKRYVLVTGDQTLHRLYDDWFWKDGGRSLDTYILRHPIQYVPFLNFRAMPNDYQDMGLFNELKKSLDNLLWLGQRAPQEDRNHFSLTPSKDQRSHKDQRSQLSSPEVAAELEGLGKLWWAAIGVANAFNFRLAIRDDVRRMSDLFSFLALPQVSKELVNEQQRLWHQIGGAHLAVGIGDSIRTHIVEMAKQRQTGHWASAGRVPLLLLADFTSLIGEASVVEFIQDIELNKKSGNSRIEKLVERVRTAAESTALLLAAAVGSAAGQWGAAEYFLNRIRDGQFQSRGDSAREKSERRDADYLYALILRFDMESAKDARDAIEILDDLEKHVEGRAGNDMELLRAFSERAALNLSIFMHAQAKSGIANEPDFPNGDNALRKADQDLAKGRALLSRPGLWNEVDERMHSAFEMMGLQIAHNSLEVAIYRYFEDGRQAVDIQSIARFAKALRALAEASPKLPVLVDLVLVAADYLTCALETERSGYKASLSSLINKVKAHEKDEMPSIDAFLADYLKTRLDT